MNILIVGCGIGGLNIGYKLLLKNYKVDLIDSNNYVGGRLLTIKGKNYQYEAGGARFNNKHKKLIKLLKDFKLNKIKISNEVLFKPSYKIRDNTNILEYVVKEMNRYTKNYLIKHSFYEIAEKIINKDKCKIMLDNFGYYSELKIMNAYDSKRSLEEDLNDNLQFYLVNEGLTELCKRMCIGIKKLSGNI